MESLLLLPKQLVNVQLGMCSIITLTLMFVLPSYYRKSATCTHVSALLHALVAMTPTHLKPGPSHRDVDEDLPVTSYPCQWKEPRKRKQSNLKISDARLEKHVWQAKKS